MKFNIRNIGSLWMLGFLPLFGMGQSVDGITADSGKSSIIQADSLKIMQLLNNYVNSSFKPDSVPVYLLGTAKGMLQRQKGDILNSYHTLLNKALPVENITDIKNWRNYLENLSPKELLSNLSPQLQGKSFSHTGIMLDEQGQVMPSYFGNSYYAVNSLTLSDQVSIKDIPVSLRFTRQDMSGNPFIERNIFSSSFNKDAFLQSMRKRLEQTIHPSDIFPEDHVLELMHEGVANLLRRQVDSIIGDAKSETAQFMQQFNHPGDLLDKDISALSQKLFDQNYLEQIRGEKNRLLQLKEKANNGELINNILMDSLSNHIHAFERMQEVYKRIVAAKQKWESDPLVQKLTQLKSLKTQKFEELLNNPATLKQLALKYLPLQGAEKFFMNINFLNIGEHATSLSPLSLQNFLSTGASMEIEKKNKYLMLIAGKEKDLNTLFDRRNFQSLFPTDHNLLGISFGTGSPATDHTHVTLMSYKQQQVSAFNTSNLATASNSLVAGIDNQFTILGNTTINMELSRSVMRYDHAADLHGSNPSVINKMTEMKDAGNDMAAMFRMQGNYQKIGLNAQASVSFIAGGYYNPGNIYLPRGTKELTFSTQKYFLKRKLTLNARGDIRRYRFGVHDDNRMQNSFFSLEGKWNASNGEFISLSYQPARNIQLSGNGKNITGVTDRLQLTGCAQHAFTGTFYRNIFSVAYSRNKYDWGSAGNVNSQSMIYTAMQSITLSSHLLYLNTTYNHANNISSVVYFNSTFTSELGYTYQVGKKINASSGIEYDAVQQWYNQVGIRQSVSMDITSRLQFSMFVDLKKNIRVYNTGYYNDLYQGDWSLHYSF